MIDTSLFYLRLKKERKKLFKSQAVAAEYCGVSRETWSRYESGKISPGMDVLAAIAAAGADVQYILTGVPGQKATESNGKSDSESDFPLDERMLLMAFRELDKAGKTAALGMISGLTSAEQPEHVVEEKPEPKSQVLKQKISSKGFVGQQFNAPVGTITHGDIINENKK